MTHSISLEQVQTRFRAQLCASCPYRTPGLDHRGCEQARPCEESCELFQLLPDLYHTGRHLEPMVGRRRRVLTQMVQDASKAACGGALHVRDHVAKTIRMVNECFYPD